MAFQLEILRAWTTGSVLSGAEDLLPPQALRVGKNVRLDRTRGLPVSRPGMTQLTSAPIDAARPLVLLHTKLYGDAADWGYVQVAGSSDSSLYRTSSAWQSPTLLRGGIGAAQVLAETNWVDGYTTPWKYFIGGGQAHKDNGTVFVPWGITGPTEPPIAASVAGSTIAGGGNTSLGSRDEVIAHVQPPSPLQVPANSVGIMAYHGQALTGTHTGGAGSATLVDGGRDFVAMGVAPGWFVQGWHGGDAATGARFAGRVASVTAHELTFATLGGQTWETGDLYQVLINMALGAVQLDGRTATDGNETVLVDNGTDLLAAGVQVGMYLYNLTSGGGGRITEVQEHALVVSQGLQAEPGLVDVRGNTLAGDQYMVYNTMASQDDTITLELYIAPEARLNLVQVFLGISPRLGTDAAPGVTGMEVRAGREVLPARLSGTPPWYQIVLKKSEFSRDTSSPEPWQMISTYLASAQAGSTPGGFDMSIGSVRMQRGSGPPSQIAVRYTVTYRISSTGDESSPPKTSEQVVLYSNTLTLERQLVRLDLSRIARAPEAGHIDQMAIYRQKEGEDLAYLVTTVPSDTTEFLDTISDEHLNIAHVLEPDNDPPHSDGVVLFGPGAQQRLFMIRDRNKLAFSKAWEYHKDRASNWPFQFELQIGDGSQEALNGLMTDQSIFVWSEDQTWQILGQGADAYVPLPVPLSHGLMGRWCLCSGDGRIFFLSKDGLYQQQGLTQQKISGDLDPFFTEETVHGVQPLSRDPSLLERCHLVWYPHPTEPELVLLYGIAGDSIPTKRLVLKKNAQTQQYTDAFFDDCTTQHMQSVSADPQALTLTYGTDHSHIWQGEVPTATDDVGTPIAGRVRLPARDQQVPRVVKTYSDLMIEANTGGTSVLVQVAFNKSTEGITAGTVTTAADNVLVQLPLSQVSAPAVLRRHHLALDLTWSGTTKVTFAQLGWHAQLEAEDLTFLDTGPLVFDHQTTLRRIHFTYDATSTVTGQLMVDGVAQPGFVLPVTTGRTRYDQTMSLPPALTRGKLFRLTLTAANAALTYAAVGEFEPEPLPVTSWDSRDITFDTRQIVRQLLFDLEAPAAISANFYADGILQESWALGPAVGRQRLNYVTNMGVTALQGTVYRLTLTSTQPFQLWGLEGVTETQPLATTFWDSRAIPFDMPQILRQLLFDVDAPSSATVSLFVDGAQVETWTLGPTAGRQRVNYVSTTGAALLRGMTYRLTIASAQALTVWGLDGVLEAQPLPTTAWDSRELTYDTPQILRQLLFDVDAPAAATATLFIDGVSSETWTVGPTTGRSRINRVSTTGAALLRGMTYRVTLTSTQALTVWGLDGVTETQPLPTTFWDSREITFDTPQICRQILLDLDTPATTTATLYIDGALSETWQVGPTAGRQRVNRVTTTGAALVRGQVYRLTLSTTVPLTLWGADSVMETQPLPTTAWDSREIAFDTPQICRQILLDVDAPAVTTATLFIDGVSSETWELGPTTGRARLNRVLTTGTALTRGLVYRLTLTSATPLTLWGLDGVMETQPLPTTDWDSREIAFDTPQICRQILLDLDAPAATAATLYIDGVSRETWAIAATAGRQRVNRVLTTGIALVRGQTYRVTLTSGTALTLWGMDSVMETQPLPTTFWDSREITFDTPQICRQILLDLDTPATTTATLFIDGVSRETWTLGPTSGRERLNRVLDTGTALVRGQVYRLTLACPSALTLWGVDSVLETQPLPTTFWDSRELAFDTPQICRQILLDLDAPAATTATLYIDGTLSETWGLGPTSGRQRVNRVLTTGAALVRGQLYRLTLDTTGPLTLWGADSVMETQPLPTTFWDSRELTYETPQILRQLLFDIDAPSACTATLYVDGTVRETFTVGPTVGRARINYVTTSGAALVKGQVFRLTLQSPSLFTLWSLSGVMESQPLATTFWDSREVTFETPQLIRQLFFDIDAPAVVSVTVYVDGAVPANGTFQVGPTNGRERIDHLFNPPLHGRTFRVTMQSAQPFTVWNLSMQAESEPLATTFWDTRQVPFILVHAFKWYALDLDAPGGATITTEINGTVRDTRTIPATTGRQRVNVWLPAGIKGRALRATLNGSSALQLWGFTAMTKPLGTSQAYQPQTLLDAINKLEEKSLTANEQRQSSKSFVSNEQRVSTRPMVSNEQRVSTRPMVSNEQRVSTRPMVSNEQRVSTRPMVSNEQRQSSKPFVTNEQRQSTKPFVTNEQRQSSKPFVTNEQRISTKPLVTIDQQRLERPFIQSGGGQT